MRFSLWNATVMLAAILVGVTQLVEPVAAQTDLFRDCSYRIFARGLADTNRSQRDTDKLRDQVIEACTRYIAQNPQETELLSKAYDARGDMFLGQGDAGRAMADYDRAIEADVSNSSAYAKRGQLFLDQGEFARALDDLTIAIMLGGANGRDYANRGRAHMRTGDYRGAIADFTKSLEFNDPEPVMRQRLSERASAHLSIGEFDNAAADATQAIDLDPQSSDLMPYLIRAEAYERKGERGRAIADYRNMHEIAPWAFDSRSLKKNIERLGGKL